MPRFSRPPRGFPRARLPVPLRAGSAPLPLISLVTATRWINAELGSYAVAPRALSLRAPYASGSLRWCPLYTDRRSLPGSYIARFMDIWFAALPAGFWRLVLALVGCLAYAPSHCHNRLFTQQVLVRMLVPLSFSFAVLHALPLWLPLTLLDRPLLVTRLLAHARTPTLYLDEHAVRTCSTRWFHGLPRPSRLRWLPGLPGLVYLDACPRHLPDPGSLVHTWLFSTSPPSRYAGYLPLCPDAPSLRCLLRIWFLCVLPLGLSHSSADARARFGSRSLPCLGLPSRAFMGLGARASWLRAYTFFALPYAARSRRHRIFLCLHLWVARVLAPSPVSVAIHFSALLDNHAFTWFLSRHTFTLSPRPHALPVWVYTDPHSTCLAGLHLAASQVPVGRGFPPNSGFASTLSPLSFALPAVWFPHSATPSTTPHASVAYGSVAGLPLARGLLVSGFAG